MNILLVIDMQKDFIDGSLGTAEAQAIVDPVIAKIREYPRENIYGTRDTHQNNYLQTREGEKLPIKHCIKATNGWQIQMEIQSALCKENIIDKPTFGSWELAEKMKERDRIEREKGNGGISIQLVGLCTDICVVSNALLLKAALPETEISVDAACCAGVTPEKHRTALETMSSCQITIENWT